MVESDGTKPIVHIRTDIEPGSDMARKAGFYDNRAAELADGYHADILAALIEDTDIAPTLLTSDEAAKLLAEAASKTQGDDDDDPGLKDPGSQWLIVIDCDDEAEQTALLQRFIDEGLEVRALTS